MNRWVTVDERNVRCIYRCPDCHAEYQIAPGDASIPYCSDADCANYERETDFDRIEIRRAKPKEYLWGKEHPKLPREDWRYDVANGDTQLGYSDWVEHNKEAAG